MTRMLPVTLVCLALLPLGLARAEVFLLRPQGEVRGELVNREQSPRTDYVIKTAAGGQVTLKAEQVRKVVPQSAVEMEYDRVRPRYADTADGQWQLAEWCRENSLNKQRKAHLERVIALDGEHAAARRALGFYKKLGRWLTQEMEKTEQGFVKYEGKWRLPQEVELIEQDRKAVLAEKGWFNKLKQWRGWLGTERDGSARESIAAIKDPAAVKALGQSLHETSDRELKQLLIDSLANVGTPAALDLLSERALNDSDEEIRVTALESLAAKKYRGATAAFIAGLKSKNNVTVNRAGVALEGMNDPSAIGPLIDALQTNHKFEIVKGNPGQMSSTFGTGGAGSPGGFSFGGGGKQIITRTLRNPDVKKALVRLSGVNFDFDVEAWKSWYASQKKPSTLDARRD